MRRSSRVSRLSLWALLTPLLISSGGLTCRKRTGDTHLSSLEIDVAGVNVIGAFDPALRVYDVWLPAGATTATVRAQPMDPAARVTWYTSLATGAIGVGGGEASIDIPPDGTQLFIGVFPPGGATDTYIVAFNPACPVGQSCLNGGLAGQCVADVCVADGIARIEITPGAAVLTDIAASHQLTAQAYNSVDQPISANFTWSSSHPGQVSVDATGRVEALVGLGSSAIVASADGVDSPASIVSIVRAVAGAVFVADHQVTGDPVPLNTDEPFESGHGSRCRYLGSPRPILVTSCSLGSP